MSFGPKAASKADTLDREARDALPAGAAAGDVKVEAVAAVYAEAFLGAAQSAGRLEELIEQFDSLVVDVLDRNPDFESVLASAFVRHEEKVGILDRVLGAQASPPLLDFLKVLSRRGRPDIVRAIHRAAREQYDRLRGRVRVLVRTAAPLDAEMTRRIAENLRRRLSAEPDLEVAVDPSILGGIVVRVGDTVYDASVANQLENLRQQMIDRSAHEIQSRRDRFRYPS